jgi:hypothetical protein
LSGDPNREIYFCFFNAASRQLSRRPVVPRSRSNRPAKPAKPPSPMQLEERERLVAEIKRHHPKATTEQIVKDLDAWGE